MKWASKPGCVFCQLVRPQVILLIVAGLSLALGVGLVAGASTAQQTRAARRNRTSAARGEVLKSYAKLPLSFEPNLGQSNPEVKFLAHGNGYSLLLTGNRALLLLRQGKSKDGALAQFRMLSLDLLRANPASRIAGSDRLPGISNYLLGDNPRSWHTNVPHYARVQYQSVYPGVDLVYYGRQQQLEYDFVLGPGANPDRINLRVRGAKGLSLDRVGNLILHLPGGAIQLRKPQAYQEAGNRRQPVAAGYVLNGDRVAFRLGNYDRRRSLVIDPQLDYLTYLGGTLNETAPKVAVDSAFNAYVAGTTNSTDFPTAGPYQATLKGTTNAFVTKLNAAGTGIVYSTYLGGSGTDSASGIAIDGGFNAYIAGTTNSSNFPVTPGSAFQSSPKTQGINHVFVTELNSSGSGLVYSTYLSGSGVDAASGIAVGPIAGTVFVTGTTQSSDFANVAKPAGRGSSQFFITKLNTSQQLTASLVYSMYLGGTSPASAVTDGGGIAVDTNSNAYITGGTNYTDLPVANAFQSTMKGAENAFVAKINAAGTTALFLTYLGGSGTDIGNGIGVDSAGNTYITGSTSSADFPVLASAGSTLYQGSYGGGASDAFATKLAASGGSLIWSTFIGGSGDDAGLGVAVDANQNSFFTGSTTSTNLNVIRAIQATPGGGTDAFAGKFDISGNAQFVTYLGGSGDDRGTGVAVDVEGNSYIAGDTTSPNLATTAG
ncbi:MAG TPA: SBBP repeat-containing protein, partial [Terriglobales bacterium]|nr:SBBP repeat-containing protein [Terriglobales bacterium]